MNDIVKKWFGEGFKNLDPLIQQLHLSNRGVLHGQVILEYGSGLSGVIGKRLGGKLGLPVSEGTKNLKVEIESKNGLLVWSRLFDSQYKMVSKFKPLGTYPDGHWQEQTGVVRLDLGVEISNGGWYWVQKNVWYKSRRLPVWLFPSSQAYKRIVDGKYEFSVSISLPLFGKIIQYDGLLELQ